MTEDDHKAFGRAILANSFDPAAWLIYADACDGAGYDARAATLRAAGAILQGLPRRATWDLHPGTDTPASVKWQEPGGGWITVDVRAGGAVVMAWSEADYASGPGAAPASPGCDFEGCDRPAAGLACGRSLYTGQGHPEVGHYCNAHAEVVADEGSPEYPESCPACGCRFGVN